MTNHERNRQQHLRLARQYRALELEARAQGNETVAERARHYMIQHGQAAQLGHPGQIIHALGELPTIVGRA
jgi:hypothetical protein